MRRRHFLKATAGGAAAGILIPRFSHAAPFGEFPTSASSLLLPTNVRAQRVLEIFLYGGLSPWETLYYVDEYGTANSEQFHTFPTAIANSKTNCGTGADADGLDFAVDANGKMVQLGPFSMPLRNRADVTSRMRLLVHKHDLEPHEAAIPHALSGKRIGNPTLAGLGAHVQRYFVDRPEVGRASPYGYVFLSDTIGGDNVNAANATGLHPGHARPLRIKVDNTNLFSLLARTGVGGPTQRTQYDAAIAALSARYQNRLRYNGAGDALRSSRFTNLSLAAGNVVDSDAIAAVLDESLFNVTNSTVCAEGPYQNFPKMSLELAVHLLTHPTEPARYACVVDTGLVMADGGGGYDGHGEVTQTTARNFTNLLESLLLLVNGPAEADPNKLSLDDTLIILNTEFGRTPWSQEGGQGRNHHPYGYVTALIGGPITTGQSGVVGAIGSNGTADAFVTAAEERMGALLAMGIWPFSPEAFGVSDVQGASTEEGAVESVTERVLGYTL